MTALQEIGDQLSTVSQSILVASGEGAKPRVQSTGPLPLAAICSRLVELQAKRKMLIRMQASLTRPVEGEIVRHLVGGEPHRKGKLQSFYSQAKAIREAIEKQKPCTAPEPVIKAVTETVWLAAASRGPIDRERDAVENAMADAARSLPVCPWASAIRGFGASPLAIIIGETGDISNYATVSRVWKRLGFAVIEGQRQQNRKDKELAEKHGYKAARHGQIVGCVTIPLFFGQSGRIDKKTGEELRIPGPYRVEYDRRRAVTENRDWPKARCDADARRVMTKCLLRDLWQAWRAADASLKP